MSNGYPYFQFHVDRWLTGKISAFDFEEQGFFLHLCMLAWVAKGAFNVCSTSVQRRFKKTAEWVRDSVAAFAEVGIIARDGDKWRIKFIDEQLRDLGELRDKRSKAGRASAAARAAETPPTPPSVTTERVEKRREEKSSVLNTRSTGVEHVLNNADTSVPPRRKRTALRADDSAWLAEVRAEYSKLGIDVDRELTKARVWLLSPKGKGRKLTQQFFINWLSRADRGMSEGVKPTSFRNQEAEPIPAHLQWGVK